MSLAASISTQPPLRLKSSGDVRTLQELHMPALHGMRNNSNLSFEAYRKHLADTGTRITQVDDTTQVAWVTSGDIMRDIVFRSDRKMAVEELARRDTYQWVKTETRTLDFESGTARSYLDTPKGTLATTVYQDSSVYGRLLKESDMLAETAAARNLLYFAKSGETLIGKFG